MRPNHTAMRNIARQPMPVDDPEPTTAPPTPGHPSDAQTPAMQGNLPLPDAPMAIIIGSSTSEEVEGDHQKISFPYA
eukprot:1599407-Pyramimonas_sp.AAC.1